MTIIFDLNGTLFDPSTGTLMDGAFDVLEHFKNKGSVMHLVSKLEPGRSEKLADLGIDTYFDSTHFVTDKAEPLARLIEAAEDTVYVVGDYLHGEIRHGNRLGARTIWLKRGHLSHLMPESADDAPWMEVRELREVIDLAT